MGVTIKHIVQRVSQPTLTASGANVGFEGIRQLEIGELAHAAALRVAQWEAIAFQSVVYQETVVKIKFVYRKLF